MMMILILILLIPHPSEMIVRPALKFWPKALQGFQNIVCHGLRNLSACDMLSATSLGLEASFSSSWFGGWVDGLVSCMPLWLGHLHATNFGLSNLVEYCLWTRFWKDLKYQPVVHSCCWFSCCCFCNGVVHGATTIKHYALKTKKHYNHSVVAWWSHSPTPHGSAFAPQPSPHLFDRVGAQGRHLHVSVSLVAHMGGASSLKQI